MPTSPHLVVAFSDHGLGHIAQAAPVVNALTERFGERLAERLASPRGERGGPELRLTVLSRAPEGLLRARLRGPFEIAPRRTGVDLVMDDALRVNPVASFAAYRDLHGPRPADWAQRVGEEAEALSRLPGGRPDLLLADVPYLPLAAAAQLGVPGVALCSFDWELMFRRYCVEPLGPCGSPEAVTAPDSSKQRPSSRKDDYHLALRIAGEIRAAYSTARFFLRPAPSVPGPTWLDTGAGSARASHVVPIGPCGAPGRRRRAELDTQFPELTGERLLFVTFGGIAMPVDLAAWPRLPGWRFIVRSAQEASRHPDALAQGPLLERLPFEDLIASMDALLTKPGYGTYVEAAASGVPVLYVPRGDWPEEPYLAAFLAAHTRALEIPAPTLSGRGLGEALARLFAQPPRPPAAITGPAEAASLLADLLGLGSKRGRPSGGRPAAR